MAEKAAEVLVVAEAPAAGERHDSGEQAPEQDQQQPKREQNRRWLADHRLR